MKIVIHVDMDAFFAAVEVRDDPNLAGKPLIIGALPNERGVVSTCSYEARKFGVRSAMSIKEAYRLCPDGIYMHPSFHKYKDASDQIHTVWSFYTDLVEYISLDEGYLDVTGTAHLFGGADNIGKEIKQRIKRETGLTCSVGIGYSMMSAKLASEEKKPDGFFAVRDSEALRRLIIDRDVRIVYGVGEKTNAVLRNAGINTVRDIYNNREKVITLLGKSGKQIVDLADGIDNRCVTPYLEAKSLGKEHTFQHDVTDFDYIRDVLLLISKELSYEISVKELYCRTVTLKITFSDMRHITRSKSGDAISRAADIFSTAASMLDKVEKRPIRLAGISLSGLTKIIVQQLSIMDTKAANQTEKTERLDTALLALQRKFGKDIIKTGSELYAKKRLSTDI